MSVCVCVCVYVCVCVCVCVCLFFLIYLFVYLFIFKVHVTAVLRALVLTILWSEHNVVDEVNVVMLNLVIISDANEFLPGGL